MSQAAHWLRSRERVSRTTMSRCEVCLAHGVDGLALPGGTNAQGTWGTSSPTPPDAQLPPGNGSSSGAWRLPCGHAFDDRRPQECATCQTEFAKEQATIAAINLQPNPAAKPKTGRIIINQCECGRSLEFPEGRYGLPSWCCKVCGGTDSRHTSECDKRNRKFLQRQFAEEDQAAPGPATSSRSAILQCRGTSTSQCRDSGGGRYRGGGKRE